MTRSKQERMPVILSVCLTQKGCSVEIAGKAYSPGLVALRTTIILRRDAVFTSSFGCGRAAVCIGVHPVVGHLVVGTRGVAGHRAVAVSVVAVAAAVAGELADGVVCVRVRAAVEGGAHLAP